MSYIFLMNTTDCDKAWYLHSTMGYYCLKKEKHTAAYKRVASKVQETVVISDNHNNNVSAEPTTILKKEPKYSLKGCRSPTGGGNRSHAY